MNIVSIQYSKQSILFCFVFLLSFIALFNTRTMYILRYLDELIIVFLVVNSFFIVLSKKYILNKEDYLIISLFIIILLIGILGNIVYKYQQPKIILEDIMRCSRWPLAYFGAKITFREFDINKNSKIISTGIFIVVSVTVLLYFLNFIYPLFEGGYMRYGIPSRPLFFEHVTFMSTGMICLMFLLFNFENEKINIVSFVLLTFMVFSGARLKQIAVVCIIWFFYLISKQLNRKVKWWIYVLAGGVCVFFFFIRGFTDIKFTESIRGNMYKQGLNIALNHFPLGSGYGTYGTETSANYTSPLYQMYGLYEVKDFDTSFISDTSWAQIFAQFGIVGTIAAIVNLVIYYLKTVIKGDKEIKEKYILRLMWMYLAVSSFASSLLMGTETLICAVTFAILENNTERIQIRGKSKDARK